jgi:hypothetical protein
VQPLPVAMSNVGFVATIPGVARFTGSLTVPAGVAEFPVHLTGTLTTPVKSQYLNAASISFTAAPPSWCSYTAPSGIATIPVYVALWHPTFSPVYRTIVQLATEGPALDETQRPQLLQKVWSKFAAKSIKSWKGTPIVYYPAGETFSTCGLTEVPVLTQLDYKSRCGGLGPILAKAFALDGIRAQEIYVDPTAATGAAGFLVKNWSVQTTSFPANAPWKWRFQTPAGGIEMMPIPAGSVYGDLKSNPGVAGQNSSTPSEKAFPNHAIVFAENRYYDSSYGLEYANEVEFQNTSIDFYYTALGGNAWIARRPDSTTGVQFSPNSQIWGPTP